MDNQLLIAAHAPSASTVRVQQARRALRSRSQRRILGRLGGRGFGRLGGRPLADSAHTVSAGSGFGARALYRHILDRLGLGRLIGRKQGKTSC